MVISICQYISQFDHTCFFKDLDINVPTDCLNDTSGINDPIQAVIRKYENHRSILKMNERIGNGSTKFSFNKIEFSEIMLEIKNIKPKKAIPFKISQSNY